MHNSYYTVLSYSLGAIESVMEQVGYLTNMNKYQSNLISKPFFVLDFSNQWIRDYEHILLDSSEKADAMIEATANTWVDAVIAMTGGSIGYAGGIIVAGTIGSPIAVACGGIIGAIGGGILTTEFLFKDIPIARDVLIDVKKGFSQTIKETYQYIKWKK